MQEQRQLWWTYNLSVITRHIEPMDALKVFTIINIIIIIIVIVVVVVVASVIVIINKIR